MQGKERKVKRVILYLYIIMHGDNKTKKKLDLIFTLHIYIKYEGDSEALRLIYYYPNNT